MQSNFPAVSDSESSTGRSSVSTGEAVPDPRTGAAPLTRRTLWYKCGKCYELLPSNTALIQHQSESCRFAVRPHEPSERLKLLIKPNYAPVHPLPPSRPYHPYLMNPNGGVTTPFAPSPSPLALSLNNPANTPPFQGAGVGGMNHHFFGGLPQFKPVPQTRDFLSQMDPGYASRAWARSLQLPQEPSEFAGNGAGDAATAARAGEEELDLELKI
ncbi:hypothetical protein PIB30_000948 [Stylosanthes scabra]|uniref:Uncharacterized protein n=1 Tax=Stylosanthes scabra TaxID=79078 RepID=A0ABU6S3Q8_9FABA|nr:hypothetical protein [Stylosanthes scabra]